MRPVLLALVAIVPLACAAKPGPCPAVAVAPSSSASAKERPPKLHPIVAGTRTHATAALVPAIVARNQRFVGCDLVYTHTKPGSSVFLRWYQYDTVESYERREDLQHTDGKEQPIKGDGEINAYLQSADGAFAPGIYECEFELRFEGQKTGQLQRGAIWLDPPPSIQGKT